MGYALARGEPGGWDWGHERGWETRARREGGAASSGSGRCWLSRLEAGPPLNLHRAAPMGPSRLGAQGRS